MIEQLRYARQSSIESVSALLVLLILDEVTTSNLTHVAKRIGISTAALTGLKDKLVRSGLVSERYSTKDRRAKVMELTANGKSLVAEISGAPAAAA